MLSTPGVGRLGEVLRALAEWQHDRAPMQLHPGDLGWHWRFGAEATAAAVRTWSRAGQILAVGLLDSPELMRLAVATHAQYDEELAEQMAADISRPERGVLPSGSVYVEARFEGPFRALLADRGWRLDAPWTPLRRELSVPVQDCGVRIEVTVPGRVGARTVVQRAAFDSSTFTDERWRTMSAGPAYADARCLVAYEDHDAAVAAVTVWSAGPGKPGLLEPMGVHREHRARGYGTSITVAAAATLRELGASSAVVCTASSNIAAICTYKSAGFQELAQVRDLRRGT